ncbi:hypothetical protein E2562_003733 [Oryza meyeriana var. granulata]|uniref:Uncharacterized protein n=1 Tax=Oryza meyeriana var. granulata TaxID=110450 RepID=A0A6G1BR36_9ORYZ|nr:hypothetical protein E2562_003733 [Oryza meyeriana var. granulata]
MAGGSRFKAEEGPRVQGGQEVAGIGAMGGGPRIVETKKTDGKTGDACMSPPPPGQLLSDHLQLLLVGP